MAGLDDHLSWDPGFCQKCSNFTSQDTRSLTQSFEHSSGLDCLQQSASSGCPLCHILVDALDRHFKSRSQTTTGRGIDTDSIYVNVEYPQGYTGSFNGDNLGALAVSCKNTACKVNLGLVDEQTRSVIFNTRPHGSHGSRSSRSLAMAKGWLEFCELYHDRCRRESPGRLPARLIDVGNDHRQPCLVYSTQATARYAVLSYCWGKAMSLRTTTDNLKQHLQNLPLSDMPATIQDAIVISRGLGVRYLWVDALCIIQDSVTDFKEQIALMGDIYHNEILMIAAKDAKDSATGCLYTSNRKTNAILPMDFLFPDGGGGVPVRTARINRALLLPKFDTPEKPKGTPVLDSRAWTLQERLLSRRILNCWEQELSWSCLERTCSESAPRTSLVFGSVQKDSSYHARLTMAGLSEYTSTPLEGDELFQKWVEVVEDYSSRELSDPRDKLFALAGVQSKFALLLKDTPFLGCWRDQYLWPSLLWYCESSQQHKARIGLSYPSWAWPSSECPVNYVKYNREGFLCDPVVTAWNLNIVEEDVKVGGSISIQCKLLEPSVFQVDEKDFNVRQEFAIPTLVWQQRYWTKVAAMVEAEKSGKSLEDLERDDNCDKEENKYYFMLVANVPRRRPKPSPGIRYAEPNGVPDWALFMVLERISLDEMHFRKVALYQEWDKKDWRDQLFDVEIQLF